MDKLKHTSKSKYSSTKFRGASKRIFGFDFARGLAILGMIFVNFEVVMNNETSGWLYEFINAISGNASALFVVLAGIGMTLMYNRAKQKNNAEKIIKDILLKRALFLFVFGLLFYFICPADILHFYGLYLSIGILFLSAPRKLLIPISLLIVVAYSASILVFDYERGWNFDTLEYSGFFTIKGFLRNLFFNGFHPVFPWIAFLLTGLWIGRFNFNDIKTRKKVLIISLCLFIVFKALSMLCLHLFSGESALNIDIEFIFGTEPMPPMFFYMTTAASLAVFVITLSVYITEKFHDTLFIRQMISTGQLALSNYFFHIIIGLGSVWLFFGKLEHAFSINFTVTYACFYCALTVISSHYWRNNFKRGPLEYLMRRITG